MAAAAPVDERRQDDTRMTIDIRVFLLVIVCSMTLSFCVGVGIIGGGSSTMMIPTTTTPTSTVELPKVTSVNMVPTATSDSGSTNNGEEDGGGVQHTSNLPGL